MATLLLALAAAGAGRGNCNQPAGQPLPAGQCWNDAAYVRALPAIISALLKCRSLSFLRGSDFTHPYDSQSTRPAAFVYTSPPSPLHALWFSASISLITLLSLSLYINVLSHHVHSLPSSGTRLRGSSRRLLLSGAVASVQRHPTAQPGCNGVHQAEAEG